MPSCRDLRGHRLLLAALVACFAAALLISAAPASANDQCERLSEKGWECVEGQYIVVFHDSVEEDPGEIAEEHIALYGGQLLFVYRHALQGYSASGLSDAAVEAIGADPRVNYMEQDIRGCAIPEGCDEPGGMLEPRPCSDINPECVAPGNPLPPAGAGMPAPPLALPTPAEPKPKKKKRCGNRPGTKRSPARIKPCKRRSGSKGRGAGYRAG